MNWSQFGGKNEKSEANKPQKIEKFVTKYPGHGDRKISFRIDTYKLDEPKKIKGMTEAGEESKPSPLMGSDLDLLPIPGSGYIKPEVTYLELSLDLIPTKAEDGVYYFDDFVNDPGSPPIPDNPDIPEPPLPPDIPEPPLPPGVPELPPPPPPPPPPGVPEPPLPPGGPEPPLPPGGPEPPFPPGVPEPPFPPGVPEPPLPPGGPEPPFPPGVPDNPPPPQPPDDPPPPLPGNRPPPPPDDVFIKKWVDDLIENRNPQDYWWWHFLLENAPDGWWWYLLLERDPDGWLWYFLLENAPDGWWWYYINEGKVPPFLPNESPENPDILWWIIIFEEWLWTIYIKIQPVEEWWWIIFYEQWWWIFYTKIQPVEEWWWIIIFEQMYEQPLNYDWVWVFGLEPPEDNNENNDSNTGNNVTVTPGETYSPYVTVTPEGTYVPYFTINANPGRVRIDGEDMLGFTVSMVTEGGDKQPLTYPIDVQLRVSGDAVEGQHYSFMGNYGGNIFPVRFAAGVSEMVVIVKPIPQEQRLTKSLGVTLSIVPGSYYSENRLPGSEVE